MSSTNKFLGFTQYTKDEFDKLTFTQKSGRLHFIRHIDESDNVITQIYFGNRLYAESSSIAANVVVNNLIKTLGNNVDASGNFIPFEIETHQLLGGCTNLTEILVIIENEILKLNERISKLENRDKIEGNDV